MVKSQSSFGLTAFRGRQLDGRAGQSGERGL